MILVTGATGNIAGYLIPTLREAGHTVRALIRDESKANLFANGRVLTPRILSNDVAQVTCRQLIQCQRRKWNGKR